MKYRVGVSEKITKDGKDYQVWKVSDKAGFYLADDIDKAETEELIDRILASCSALAVKMEAEEILAEQRKNAENRNEIGSIAADKSEKAFLVRKRTSEKIVIDKDVFRLGKDASCVDYLVGDNPTISRNHADILRKNDGFYAIDKGSLNHTFVDGKKLEAKKPQKLESGSLLQLADEVFDFIQE